MLRGAEICGTFDYMGQGRALEVSSERRLNAGEIDMVSPRIGDIHEVANAFADDPAVSIHVYGANMATIRRHDFDPATGLKKSFASRYCDDLMAQPRVCPTMPEPAGA
jgi:predicted metal-dependent enzyme (double-stranded beta helix superfamily)